MEPVSSCARTCRRVRPTSGSTVPPVGEDRDQKPYCPNQTPSSSATFGSAGPTLEVPKTAISVTLKTTCRLFSQRTECSLRSFHLRHATQLIAVRQIRRRSSLPRTRREHATASFSKENSM
jgi:hypothetical protein